MESQQAPERCLSNNVQNNISALVEENLQNVELDEGKKDVDGKKVVIIVSILGFAQFVVFLSAFIVSSFYPQAAQEKGLTGVEIGWILGILHVVVLVTAFGNLKLLHFLSLKKQLIIGLIGSGAACGLFGLAYFIEDKTAFTVVQFVLRFIHGASLAVTDISSFILTNIKTPIKFLSTAVGVLEGLLSLSLLTTAPLGSYLYQVGGYYTPFLVCGGACLLYAVLVYFYIEETEYESTIEVSYAIKQIFTWSMSYYLYAFLLYGSLVGLFSTMLEPKLREFSLSLSEVGVVMMIFNAAQAIAFQIWGQICDRSEMFGLVSTMSYVLAIVAMVMFGPFPFTGPIFGNFNVFIASIVVCAIGMSALSVATFSMCKINLLKACSDEGIAGTLVSVAYIGFANAGITCGDVLGGVVIDYLGYSLGAVVWCVLLIIAILYLLVSILFERKATKSFSPQHDVDSNKL